MCSKNARVHVQQRYVGSVELPCLSPVSRYLSAKEAFQAHGPAAEHYTPLQSGQSNHASVQVHVYCLHNVTFTVGPSILAPEKFGLLIEEAKVVECPGVWIANVRAFNQCIRFVLADMISD